MNKEQYYKKLSQEREQRFKAIEDFNNLLNSYRQRASSEGRKTVYFAFRNEIYSFDISCDLPESRYLKSIVDNDHAIKIPINIWIDYANQVPVCLATQYERFHFEFIKSYEIVKSDDSLFNLHYLRINDKNHAIAYTEKNGIKSWGEIAIPYSIYLEWKKVFENKLPEIKQLNLFETKIYSFYNIYNKKSSERIHLTIDEKNALCGVNKDFQSNYTLLQYHHKEANSNTCIKCSRLAKKQLSK